LGSDNSVQSEVTDKYSLRGRVFNKLREDILYGRYKRNDELRETTISTELGVSRTPVREAIRQLELEGLVSVIPNKGAVVTGLDAKDVLDIYAIRSVLEGLSARWAITNITDQQIEQLEEILYLSEFHLKKGHLDTLYELDNKFHDIIYEASNSRQLRHVLSDFHHYVEKNRQASLSSYERAVMSVKEHESLVEAFKNRDADEAERLANLHIKNSAERLAKMAKEQLL
jgi:DNA-binding GntR family transcriptional regulator